MEPNNEDLKERVEDHFGTEENTKKENASVAARVKNGFILLGMGSVVCFSSCILTILNSDPALTGWLLYGLTSLGVIKAFAGLVMVFE